MSRFGPRASSNTWNEGTRSTVDSDDERLPDSSANESLETGFPGRRVRRRRNSIRDSLLPLAAIGVVIAAIVALQWFRGRDSDEYVFAPGEYSTIDLGPSGEGSAEIGKPAPGFSLLDPDGRPVNLRDFEGTPVVVNFWATWCVPCRKETPDLVELQAEWGSSAQIVGINYYELREPVVQFATDYGVTYPLLLDRDGRVTGSYSLRGLPETFFIDGAGIVRDQRIGQLDPDIARCIVAGMNAGSHEPRDCR